MAASFLIAARNNGFAKADARAATQASVTAYREAMAAFAQMSTMDVWYAHLDEDELRGAIRGTVAETKKQAKEAAKGKKGEQQKLAKIAAKRAEKNAAKAHTRDSLQSLSKLGELAGGQYRIVSQPPVIVPARDLAATYGLSPDEVMPLIHGQFRAYRATLQPDRRHLLERFEIVDAARKVVGVGSVGTRAFIVLLQGCDAQDPLFLQIKEATASVLEGYLPKSRYPQHGARVVHGQRMMQAASDIYLGWTKGLDVNRHFYWRQLRDMKGSALVELMTPLGRHRSTARRPRDRRDRLGDHRHRPGHDPQPGDRRGRHPDGLQHPDLHLRLQAGRLRRPGPAAPRRPASHAPALPGPPDLSRPHTGQGRTGNRRTPPPPSTPSCGSRPASDRRSRRCRPWRDPAPRLPQPQLTSSACGPAAHHGSLMAPSPLAWPGPGRARRRAAGWPGPAPRQSRAA